MLFFSFYKKYRYSFIFWLSRQDMWIWFSVIFLLFFGVLIVFSLAAMNQATSLSLLQFWQKINKRLILYCVGFFLITAFSNLSDRWLKKYTPIFFFCSLFLLFLTSLGLGKIVNGARRWISIFGFSFQPSELIKPALILFSAYSMDQAEKKNFFIFQNSDADYKISWWSARFHFLLFFFYLCLVSFLLIIQPDVGTTVLLNATIAAQFFSVGFPIFFMVGIFLIILLVIVLCYQFLPHVSKRINAFLGLSAKDQYGQTYQVFQAENAFKKGGLFGLGLSEGEVKYYIPDVHNDFIIALVGEEIGFLGCLLLLSIFFLLIARLFYHAYKNKKNIFHSLSIFGIAICFLGQIFIHISSATGLIPPKGMTLPFISSGGSSLIMNSMMIGIALSLSKKNK